MAGFIFSEHYLEDLGGREPLPLHQRFYDMMRYLEDVAPDGRLAGRQHIDPLDFSQVIALVNLMDVERADGTLRFRFRLVGTEQTRRAGREHTGLLIEEVLAPELVARVNSNMRRVLQVRVPVFDTFPMSHPQREFILAQRMYFPLASDGETIDMLLTLHGYDPDPALERTGS